MTTTDTAARASRLVDGEPCCRGRRRDGDGGRRVVVAGEAAADVPLGGVGLRARVGGARARAAERDDEERSERLEMTRRIRIGRIFR